MTRTAKNKMVKSHPNSSDSDAKLMKKNKNDSIVSNPLMKIKKKTGWRGKSGKQFLIANTDLAKVVTPDSVRKKNRKKPAKASSGVPVSNNLPSIPGWSRKELFQLVRQMEANIPDNDNVKYQKRLSLLDWDKVSFDGHSSKDCQKAWSTLSPKIRKFRILTEVAVDIQNMLNDTEENKEREQKRKQKIMAKAERRKMIKMKMMKRESQMVHLAAVSQMDESASDITMDSDDN